MLISVERPLSIDSSGQMVASILSKKIAAGSTAKVRSMPEAQRLRRLFEYVAQRLGTTPRVWVRCILKFVPRLTVWWRALTTCRSHASPAWLALPR